MARNIAAMLSSGASFDRNDPRRGGHVRIQTFHTVDGHNWESPVDLWQSICVPFQLCGFLFAMGH